MNLSFKHRFVNPILGGKKIHTIREDKHGRWCAGKAIHFCTGLRTKAYNCFRIGTCVSTQTVKINGVRVWIDDRELDSAEIDLLARNDGLLVKEEFFAWFNKDFVGKIIHWTDFRYDAHPLAPG